MGTARSSIRRVLALVGVLAALIFAYQAGPAHGDPFDVTHGQAAAATTHHAGDGDAHPHGSGDLGAVHCAGHCGGHSATDAPPMRAEAHVTHAAVRYPPTASPALVGHDHEPLMRPPAV